MVEKKLVCDFCSSLDVLWRYPVRTFKSYVLQVESLGDWAACGKCHDLIEAGKIEELAKRSAETHPLVTSGEVKLEEMLEACKVSHMSFRDSRCGKAILLTGN